MKKFDVVIYESLPILKQLFLHRFLVAQAKDLLELGYNVTFCTGDDPYEFRTKFIDVYGIDAAAVNCRDKQSCKMLNPKILFTSRIDSAIKIKLSNKFKNITFTKILWYGGVIPEESYLRRNSNLRRLVLIALERVALKWADIVIIPTHSMLAYLETNNRLSKKTKYLVVPNGIDALPPLVSDSIQLWELKENNRPVIGYCGGLSKWQCFDETLEFIKNIQRIDPNILFLVLTYDPQKALEMISKKGLANTIVKQTTPERVYSYIQAFDVGILFRHENAVNGVAFPLKYLDYISNGVPVITTNAVKAITNDSLSNYGYIINFDDIDYSSILMHIKSIVSKKSLIKQNLRDHAASKWTFAVVNAQIRGVYSEIIETTKNYSCAVSVGNRP